MPSWVEESRAFNPHAGHAGFQRVELRQSSAKVYLVTKDADKTLHDALQIIVNGIGAVAFRPFEGGEYLPGCLLNLRRINARGLARLGVFGSCQSRSPAKHQQIGERVSAQSVCSVQAHGGFSRGEQPRD